MRKSISLVTCARKVPIITIRVTMPLRTTLSPVKLTSDEVKAWSFSYLASSTKTQASWWYVLSFYCQWTPDGCWTLLLWEWLLVDRCGVAWCCDHLSLISGSSFFGIFIGGSREWTLFISLPCAFFRDFNIRPTVSPPEIVFISPAGGLLSLISRVLSWSSFRCYLWGSILLMYFCNFPCRIKVST